MSDKLITGALFCEMVQQGALAIDESKEKTNELNVFPVPDGDTGSNMAMTMESAAQAMQRLHEPTLAEAADATAAALLRGARGNSGVILSLLFRGIAKRLRETEQAEGVDLALALREGVETAYKAVMKPAEGTILTVSRVSAQAALQKCQESSESTVGEVLDTFLVRARTALAETQTQNPVLQKAGVVDAGAFGLICIFEGMQDAYNGVQRARTSEPAPERSAEGADFSAIHNADITFTYCTEFIAERKDKARSVGRMRATLDALGDSLVVVDDDEIVKVHVHTDAPNKVLEEGLKFGPLLTVKIENMREQHTAKVIEGSADTPESRHIAPPEKPFGFVAVAAGEGVVALFRELGCDEVVQGGQTMNPSTYDILRAVDAVPAETVFVLPNNKNIIMAAQQAAELSEEKQVIVVPSKTVPQGMSAMLAAELEGGDAQQIAAKMEESAKAVHTGQVTYAARDSEFDGKKIRKGEFLGLSEGKLCANGKESSVLKKLVRELHAEQASFATVIYGEDVSEREAQEVAALLQKQNRELEVSLLCGAQPVYRYILSVE